MKKFNECELGNPSFPSDMTGVGSPDKWDNVLSIQKQNSIAQLSKFNII